MMLPKEMDINLSVICDFHYMLLLLHPCDPLRCHVSANPRKACLSSGFTENRFEGKRSRDSEHLLSASSPPASSPLLSPSTQSLRSVSRSSCCRVMGKGKDTRDSTTAAISTVPLTKTPSKHYGEDEGEEDRFHNALLELKDLRSQLYDAADYCETAFSKAEQKKTILEGTKSYICEAIVAVVDHLGNVSSKLEQSLLANTAVVQTERRIDCLKQRLLTCQQYAISLELSSMQLSLKVPQHHEHYVSAVTQHIEKSSDLSRPGGSETPTKKDHMAAMTHSLKSCAADHFLPASNQTILGVELAKAAPVVKGPSVLSRPRNPSLKFKPEDLYMLGGVYQKKKPMQVNNILSFLRVSKRKT